MTALTLEKLTIDRFAESEIEGITGTVLIKHFPDDHVDLTFEVSETESVAMTLQRSDLQKLVVILRQLKEGETQPFIAGRSGVNITIIGILTQFEAYDITTEHVKRIVQVENEKVREIIDYLEI